MNTRFRAGLILVIAAAILPAQAQANKLVTRQDVPYVESGDPLQKLDIHAPSGAKNAPVVVWIHGGGWETGDKKQVLAKPQAFADKGLVFVSINYRLLPKCSMGELNGDVARAILWVHKHIAEYGGDPERLLIMGHSAGAQLAALMCTDDRYLKAAGLSLSIIKGCVPVDGDTYNVPLMIQIADLRRKALGQPEPKFGHRGKFGAPEQHAEYSPVTHVAKDKNIPPFLLLYVEATHDTNMQARHLAYVLTQAGHSATLFGAADSNHRKLNDDLGTEGDPKVNATRALMSFVDRVLAR